MGGKTRTSWKPGQSGNPTGRQRNPYVQQLHDALKKFEEDNDKSFIQHCIEQAKTEPALATALMKKVMPDLKYVESDVNVSGGVTLDHVKDNDLRKRIIELESLGNRGTISSKTRGKIKRVES